MENLAFKRGAVAARLWLKFTKSARAANDVCVAWVSKHKLPKFIGYFPVPTACVAVFGIAIVCGFFIGTFVILGSLFVYMLCNIAVSDTENRDDTDELSGYQYRDGNDGFGMYSGPQSVTVTSTRTDRDDEDD